MKSKSTAYLLWFFFGLWGGHKFYLGKVGMGIIYFFTFGVFGIGWFIDLFTLGNQVDIYNALYGARMGNSTNNNNNVNNIVVNVPTTSNSQKGESMHEQLSKLAELKEKGILTDAEFNAQKAKILS
jgi:TM2 domain-containing membrane protein YozV